MKKLTFFEFFLIIFAVVVNIISSVNVFAKTDNSDNYKYQGEITHLFTHCLLAFPEIALSSSNPMKSDYDRDCITKNEFKKILHHLYINNYILINPHDFYKFFNNKLIINELFLPKNKKPLIFSFDDVNYDRKKMGKGMVDKLIISDGEVKSSTNFKNKTIISNDNEFVPILEAFVKEYPDFSYNNAKGTICLTGYDGILGYRTQKKNTINRDEEVSECKKVVEKLKQSGWTFACHSFGHYHLKSISAEKFKKDIEQWNDEVVPIIGETDIYVYPYGEWEILNENNKISQKHKILTDNGFKLFCGVGVRSFLSYFPRNFPRDQQILFMDRCPIDGFTLKNRGKDLSHLFPYQNVFDYAFR